VSIQLSRLFALRDASAAANLVFPAFVVPSAAFITLGADILLSRLLGPAEYGRYSLAYAVAATVVILASVGIPTILPRVVAEFQVGRNETGSESLSSFLGGSFALGLASTSILGTACLSVYGLVLGTTTTSLFVATATLTIALFVWLWCRGVSIGRRLILQATIPKEVVAPMLVVGAVALFKVSDAVLVCLLTAAATVVVHTPFLAKVLVPSFQDTTTLTRWYATKHWLSPALSLGLTSLATIGFFKWDILILGLFVEAEIVAGYVAASKIALAAIIVQRVIEFGSTKYVVESLADSARTKGLGQILRLAVIAGLFAVGTIGVFSLVSDIALSAFGSFASAFKPHLLILLAGQCFVAATAVFDIAAVAGGAHRARAIWVVSISGVNLAANFYAASQFGSLGCAVATACTTAIMRTGIAFIAWRHILSPKRKWEAAKP